MPTSHRAWCNENKWLLAKYLAKTFENVIKAIYKPLCAVEPLRSGFQPFTSEHDVTIYLLTSHCQIPV